jgi:signal transduction histidine kinase
LIISSIKLSGDEVFPGSKEGPPINDQGEIVLNYKQNYVSIDFIAMNYFSEDRNQYSYKLIPVSSEYIDLGNKDNLIFSNLAPGHYTLSLIVETENGGIQESPEILKIYIVPPFWKTNWFKYLLIISLVLVSGGSVWLYTSNLRDRKRELEEEVHNRTLDLENSNSELKEQARALKSANKLLSERKVQIENQSEELQTQSEELAKKNEDLTVLNTMKDKFFTIIGHDLKNPFNIISGFADLLHQRFDTYSDEKKKELLQNIRESASVAHALLENLLQWSRAQSGRLKVNISDISVKELFGNQDKLFKPTMLQKNLDLHFDVSEQVFVKADLNLIDTVIRNLISNAFKFTPSGGMIKVSANKYGREGLVKFEVSDTGTGIEKDDLEKIFRIDQSVSRSGTEGETGTGLGMLLCKEFVEKMNGEIWIESVLGKGTGVIFTLPQA